MRYQAFVRGATGALATVLFGAGAALAQTTSPQPSVMTDTAPLPAGERGSLGAVIMMDQPVLAQREAMLAAQERAAAETRALGAGPNRIMRRAMSQEELEFQKALDAAERTQQGTPK